MSEKGSERVWYWNEDGDRYRDGKVVGKVEGKRGGG